MEDKELNESTGWSDNDRTGLFCAGDVCSRNAGTGALATMAWRPDAVEIVRIAKAQHYEDIKIQRGGAFAASLWHSCVQIPGNQ